MPAGEKVLNYVSSWYRNDSERPHLLERDMLAADSILDILASVDNGTLDVSFNEFFTKFEEDSRDSSRKAKCAIMERRKYRHSLQ
uniref:Uncharacterized protein n=1 Tax=Caenorhabditis japonica TaxID=281687 RepID=A0A8R1IBN6_CAEJA